ncbi:MAG: carbon monoxide dehydrogenase [Methanospirillaceae archaeon]|nr:carbon monoxide dehydrogenase [Methanospirillaceae archaeon]
MEERTCSCNSHNNAGNKTCYCSTEKIVPFRNEIPAATSTLTVADHWDHLNARLGFRRMKHTVQPGLYRIGNPTPESMVFVSANYTLSFDALRSSLTGYDAYILVIDTKGINVWCAAGKGTFGTGEIVSRIQKTDLSTIVSHRNIIIPQLGAPGVSAHEVAQRSGFTVRYGPVRATDIPRFLKTRTITPAMREVTFSLRDRLVLIPVELVHILKFAIPAILLSGILVSWDLSYRILLAIIAGTILFPMLMPYLPTKDFSTKGFFLGWIIFLPCAVGTLLSQNGDMIIRAGMALAELLVFPAVVAYLALNFTGSTPFASRSGVKKEIHRYIRPMAGLFLGGVLLSAGMGILSLVIIS